MSSPEPDPNPAAAQPDAQQRVHELELQLATERATHEFDVPAALFGRAQTPEDIERIASEALLWRAETAPPPTPPATAAVSADMVTASTGVIGAADRMLPRYQQVATHEALKSMTAQEIMAHARSGNLVSIGVGVPKSSGLTPMTRRS